MLLLLPPATLWTLGGHLSYNIAGYAGFGSYLLAMSYQVSTPAWRP